MMIIKQASNYKRDGSVGDEDKRNLKLKPKCLYSSSLFESFPLTQQSHLLEKKRFSLCDVSSSFSGPAQSTCGYSWNASPCLSRFYTLMHSVLGFVIRGYSILCMGGWWCSSFSSDRLLETEMEEEKQRHKFWSHTK